MFRLVIKPRNGSDAWFAHDGWRTDAFVFSAERIGFGRAGWYPVESLGALYRNIDDLRQSPLQSRTDWEARMPAVHAWLDQPTPKQLVDLLYWLETVNLEKNAEFSLLGSRAILYKIDGGSETPVYTGTLESVSGGSESASLRISDWLGNPWILAGDFPIVIGEAGAVKWPAQVTRERFTLRLELGDFGFRSEPDLWLKLGDDYRRIESFVHRSIKNNSNNTENWYPYLNKDYSDGYGSLVITLGLGGFELTGESITVGPDDDILLGFDGLRGGILTAQEVTDIKMKPFLADGKPVYYALGKGDDFEPLEHWSKSSWEYEENWPLGRALHPDGRRQHSNERIRSFDEGTVFASVLATLYPESMIGADNQYAKGNPSQFIHNSRPRLPGEDYYTRNDWQHCPCFKFYRKQYLDSSSPFWFWYTHSIKFTVNMSDGNLPGDALAESVVVYIALRNLGAELSRAKTKAIIKFGDKEVKTEEFDMDGNVCRFEFSLYSSVTGSPAYKKISELLPCEFTLSDLREWPVRADSDPLLASRPEYEIRVCYLQLEFQAYVPIADKKIYVSGERDSSLSGESTDGTRSVGRAVLGLLSAAGMEDVEVDGSANSISYGAAIKSGKIALRERLRSLAAESATLIRLDPLERKIILSDIALQYAQEDGPIDIPLSAFVLAGNIYSFKMESPELGELLSGVEIRWGKDIDTGKYAHVLSVSTDGIAHDGAAAEPLHVPESAWDIVISRMKSNSLRGIGTEKGVDTEWITDWAGAENMAYNLLRWNTAPLRKAQARCIFTELDGRIDIGSFVRFPDLPGYPQRLHATVWAVTGRHDGLDSMETALELIETPGLDAAPPASYLLLENGDNVLLEDGQKIKLEEQYG